MNIFEPGLADASMETWAGMALLGVLGFVLGFALNHGSICTVIATRELVSEKRPAQFIALVECAVWAALVYAILETSPMMQQGWSPLGYLVPAAMLFGLGTYVNGACVFGSVGHFGNGEIDFGFAFLGIFAVVYIESLFGLLPDQPPISASLPLGPGLLALALLAILALRLGVSLRSESNFRRLTLSIGTLGITYTILAVFAPGFSITASVGSIVSIPVAGAVISVCMFGGSLVSARFMEASIHAEMADNQDHSQENAWRHAYGIGCATHSRWERYAAADWFPHGGMAGRARLRAIRCDACCAHRQIRFDGKILVMTVAHVTHRTGRQNLPIGLHQLRVRFPRSRRDPPRRGVRRPATASTQPRLHRRKVDVRNGQLLSQDRHCWPPDRTFKDPQQRTFGSPHKQRSRSFIL